MKKRRRVITEKTIKRDVSEFIELAMNSISRLEVHLILLSTIFVHDDRSFTQEQEDEIRELAQQAGLAGFYENDEEKVKSAVQRLAAAIYKAGNQIEQTDNKRSA